MDALDIAKNMQLVAGPPEAVKPLNVGLLMFRNVLKSTFVMRV